ncbi:MAG: hypothetical protein HQL31_03510 [Planctomycetes bacterium]|nr:hypothetical protein [Planctomycetota bacterium]
MNSASLSRFAIIALLGACLYMMAREKSGSDFLLPQLQAQSGLAVAKGGVIALDMGPETLVLIDSANQKMLLYDVKSTRGLILREVRPYDKALSVPRFYSSKGLVWNEEEKVLDKYLKTGTIQD